ncbi:hypothetical protein GQ457_09G012360 [Hibiscus cannabinus]
MSQCAFPIQIAVTFSTLINGLCNQCEISQALTLFDEMAEKGMMKGKGFRSNIVAYRIVIDCLCKRGLLDEACNLISEVCVKGIRPDIVVYNCLIHAMCSFGGQKQARMLLNEMVGTIDTTRKQCIEPDVVTYSALADAYCKEGVISKAANTIDSMKKQHIQPNVVTYNTLVDAYYKKGMIAVDMLAMVPEAEDIIDTMIAQGVEQCFILMLEPFHEISQKFPIPDAVTYNTFMQGTSNCFRDLFDFVRWFMLKRYAPKRH